MHKRLATVSILMLATASCTHRHAVSQAGPTPQPISPATQPDRKVDGGLTLATAPTTFVADEPSTQAMPTTEAIPSTIPTTVSIHGPASMPDAPASVLPVSTTAPAVTTTPPEAIVSPPAVTQPAAVAVAPASQPGTPAAAPTTTPAAQASPQEPVFNPAPASTQPDQIAADSLLAERLSALARDILATKVSSKEVWPPLWGQVSAVLEGASKLAPSDPRFARLWAQAELERRDHGQAKAALFAVRQADPQDEFSMVQALDLYATEIETVDARLAYYKDMLGKPALPESVRSHAAVAASRLLAERGENDDARNMLSQALRLNPLNIEGLQLRLANLPANASAFERCVALLALLKANPAQSMYAAQLGNELAEVGLLDPAVAWLDSSVRCSMRTGQTDFNAAVNLACAFYVDDQPQQALGLSEQLVKADPANPANWFVRLLLLRSASHDVYDPTVSQAGNAMGNHLVEVMNRVADAKATTRPIESSGQFDLPDLLAIARRVKQANSPDATADLTSALSDLAWLNLYYARQPAAAQRFIDAIAVLVPADSPVLARLQGWSALLNNHNDEALAKLTEAAKIDPLSKLGIIRLSLDANTDRKTVASEARKLISDHPAGLLGAMLYEGLQSMPELRDLKVRPIPSAQADAIRGELDRFPKDWLKVTDQPQNFYGIFVQPLKIACLYREPMLARVTIQNLTDNDITIGRDGVLHRELWFSAQIKGFVQQAFGAVAVDQIAGPQVLHARSSTSQVVRLDQGELQAFMLANPAVNLQVYGGVMTNPIGIANGVTSAPGGYRVDFTKVFARQAMPLNNGKALQDAMTDMANGTVEEKFNAIGVAVGYAEAMRSAKNPDEKLRQAADSIIQAISRLRNSENPSLAAWASFWTLRLSGPAQQPGLVRELATNSDWRQRMIGTLLLNAARPETQTELLQTLQSDPEPCVRRMAQARQELMKVAPTTAP